MSRVAILAPMPIELKPIVQAAKLRRDEDGGGGLHRGTVGGVEVVAVRVGVGTAASARATERLLDSVDVDHVVVVGVAGGVPPHVAVRELVVPEVVVDGETGAEYRPTPVGGLTPAGVLRTSDEFITDLAVITRLAGEGVVALDMETAAIAGVCEQRELPWSVFRAVSDMAGDPKVGTTLVGLLREDGSPDIAKTIRAVLRRPSRLGTLRRVGRDSTAACRAAARAALDAVGAMGGREPGGSRDTTRIDD